MTEAVRYSDMIRAKSEPELVEAAREAARAKGQKPSEYVRQALREAVERDAGAKPVFASGIFSRAVFSAGEGEGGA